MAAGMLNVQFVHRLTKWLQCLGMQLPMQFSVDRTFTQPGTTFNSPEPISSGAGKGHYGRQALSGKVTGISNIRFRIFVHYPKNDHKCTFSAPRVLWNDPITVFVIGSSPGLCGKVATMSHIGYQIQISRLKIRQGPSFPAPRLLRCQYVSKIRSSGIIRQGYGYSWDSIRNSDSMTL
ncbi:hypothetical protein TNCV_964151 [Trichonephila clavipes]|nr:hypothetical protein TNCV_964151 [Trichonephila clavipes]